MKSALHERYFILNRGQDRSGRRPGQIVDAVTKIDESKEVVDYLNSKLGAIVELLNVRVVES
jgi:hypothetical protein